MSDERSCCAVLAEVDRILTETYEDECNPAGACYRIRRAIDDQAPPEFRDHLHYREGRALDG